MNNTMTEQQARYLARRNRSYVARKIRGNWCVWDSRSDHYVEFDHPIDLIARQDDNDHVCQISTREMGD